MARSNRKRGRRSQPDGTISLEYRPERFGSMGTHAVADVQRCSTVRVRHQPGHPNDLLVSFGGLPLSRLADVAGRPDGRPTIDKTGLTAHYECTLSVSLQQAWTAIHRRPVTFIAMRTDAATLKRVYAMSLAGVYPHYVAKAEKKGRTKAEVDEIIRWLTGYTQEQLDGILEKRTNLETFITKARMNPSRTLVTGAICGVRVEEIEDPVMQGMRYLDKLIDELAKGRPMEKILRKG